MEPTLKNVYDDLLKGNKCILNKEISMLNESGSIMIESKRETIMKNKINVDVSHLVGPNKNVIAHDSIPKYII